MSYIDIKQVGLQDSGGSAITPAQDETLILLRRLVQLAQSLAVTDAAQRQRVAVETSVALSVSGTVTANQGGTWNINSVNQLAGVDPRYQMIDWARQAYNSGIRANLINS